MGGAGKIKSGEGLQLPSAVAQLSTSLADVNVTDLENRRIRKEAEA